jgi:O-methyltransferase involved in polyketide biosynthesis
MYPFACDGAHRFFEFDTPEVVAYKQRALERLWQAEVLPRREIHFRGGDLNNERDRAALPEAIRAAIGDVPCYVVCEGVLFYLHQDAITPLFETFRSVQRPGDRLGVVSFPTWLREERNPAYMNFLEYFDKRLGIDTSLYSEIPDAWYEALPGYTLQERTEFVGLSHRFAPERALGDPKAILNEYLYVLERI